MKKRGFTLSEILVTLTIVGIIAAIAAPAFTKAKPDRYKTRVLRNYNAICKITSDLLDNDSIYYRKDPSTATENDANADGTFKTNTQYGCIGLNCTEAPLEYLNDSNKMFIYSGLCKYPNLVADSMFTDFDISNNYVCNNSALIRALGNTADGTSWLIEPAGNTADAGYKIMFDLNPANDSPNCSYNSSTCKYPDQFKLFVDVDGNVKADSDDKLTAVYLNNMTRTDKKADFDEAAAQ